MSRMNGPDEEYNYCDEHGEYPLEEFECPGCAEAEQRIDEAIERAHEQRAKGG
jgi:hypothetical protein